MFLLYLSLLLEELLEWGCHDLGQMAKV